MRIAMANLTAGGLSGGYLTYLASVVPLLREQPGVTELGVFVPGPASALVERGVAGVRVTGEGRRDLASAVTGFRPDVVFVPTARWLRVPDVPSVTMVRNMEPLTVPFAGNSPVDAARNLGRNLAARQACRRSQRVVAVSDHVRRFLVERWHIPEERIGVVHHGVGAPLLPEQRSRPPAMRSQRPFVFTAGSIRPARGLEDLLDALYRLQSRGTDIDLVVAGGSTAGSHRYHRLLRRRADRTGIGHQVTWTGPLSTAEMAWCYAACRVFVTTTRAEACPNTALEAMSHGCVTVSTDVAPMPEILVDTAEYYRGGDGAALAQALERALALDGDARRSRQEAARRRAADFYWHDTARRTAAELRRAVDAGANG